MSYKAILEGKGELITIKRPTLAKDDWGNSIITLSDYLEVQGVARKMNSGNTPQYVNGKEVVHEQVRFYFEFKDIKVNDVVVYQDREYRITSVNNVMHYGRVVQVDAFSS